MDSYWFAGRGDEARRASIDAKKWGKIGVIVGACMWGVGVALVITTSVLSLLVVGSVTSAQSASRLNTAGPKNMASNGIVLTGETTYQSTAAIPNKGIATPTTYTSDGKAHITIYIDFQDPWSNQFLAANNAQVSGWLESGKATLEIHPVAILDQASNGNMYSTRSANAAACVADYDPSTFFAVLQELYQNQPSEGANGRTDGQILSYLAGAGTSSTQITDCVHNQTFKGWVATATNQFVNDPIPNLTTQPTQKGVPTIVVNNKQYTGSGTDGIAFQSFAESASGVTLP